MKKKGSPEYETTKTKSVKVENKSKAKPVTVTKTVRRKNPVSGSGLGNTSYTKQYKRAT